VSIQGGTILLIFTKIEIKLKLKGTKLSHFDT